MAPRRIQNKRRINFIRISQFIFFLSIRRFSPTNMFVSISIHSTGEISRRQQSNRRTMFLKLVRYGTIRIVIRQIRNSISFRGILSIECFVPKRTFSNPSYLFRESRIIEPSFKGFPIYRSRSLKIYSL